jgi:hypothetical protein
LRWILTGLIRETYQSQQFQDPPVDFRALQATVFEPISNVFMDSEVREQGVGLEHDAEIPFSGRQGCGSFSTTSQTLVFQPPVR